MIRHMLAFRFREEVGDELRAGVLAELATFPTLHRQMRNFALGENISTRDTSMTHAFTVCFESETDLLSYLHSEEHESFVVERWRPVIESQIIATIRE